jgi:hypothetical protein
MANNENMALMFLLYSGTFVFIHVLCFVVPYLLMMDKLSGLSGWKDGIFKEYLEKSLEWTALRPLNVQIINVAWQTMKIWR